MDDGSEQRAVEAIAGSIFSDLGRGCFGRLGGMGSGEVGSGLGLDNGRWRCIYMY